MNFRDIFTKPPAEVLAARDLAESKRQRLHAHSALEYHKAAVLKCQADVEMFDERIERLALDSGAHHAA